MTACALYRHYDADNACLYVGVTNNPKRRLAEHKSRSVWAEQIDRVEVKWMRTREEALSEERAAIIIDRPLFNGGDRALAKDTGNVFKDWMNRSGETQESLSKITGIAQSTISQMVNGKRRTPLRFAVIVEDLSEGEVPCRYWMFGATAEAHGSEGPVLPDEHAPATGGAK